MSKLTCQMTMSDNGENGTGIAKYFPCGKPAKFWIKDQFNRSGWNGRQLLCGIHARAHDIVAKKANRSPATPL